MAVNKLFARFCLLLTFILMPFTALAQNFDYNTFSKIPVVHEGRIKPLGRVAQIMLGQMSGVNVTTQEATPWLAQLLFNPGNGDDVPLFLVAQKNLRHVLGLADHDGNYYSFDELNKAFTEKAKLILSLRNQEAGKLSPDQIDLLALYARVTYYEQTRNAMTGLLPLVQMANSRFIDLKPGQAPKIQKILLAQGKNNETFRIIPLDGKFFAPWQMILQEPENTQLLDLWSTQATAYLSGDAQAWQENSQTLYNETIEEAGMRLLPLQLQTELFYNALHPYSISLIFYALGLGLIFLAFYKPQRKKHITLRMLAWSCFFMGFGLHVLGILCRVIILQRPPVSNLYESILFVGAMMVGACLVYAWRKQEDVLLPVAGIAGIALHLLGFAINSDDDTLKVLQAVLNTKFWLATHVTIITTGYALCLITSGVAHLCLYRRLPAKLMRQCNVLALVSLLFISIGTLLGGVWADQSWGRFWGWDPKENGALLIALWLVWLLHGKISRHINETWYVAGLVALTMVVSMSWIGVNLLGIGLHSYGFLNGSVTSLVLLFTAEILFLGFCIRRIKT